MFINKFFKSDPCFFIKSFSAFFLLLIIFCRVFLLLSSQPNYAHHHYFSLAQSLQKGRVDVTRQVTALIDKEEALRADYSFFEGDYYVPLAPLPAVFYLLLFFLPFQYAQTTVLLTGLVSTVLILRKLFLKYVDSNKDSVYFYIAATLYSSPILTVLFFTGPWYTSGLIGVCLSFYFLYFYKVKKKSWAILLIFPMALTRIPLLFYIFLPLFDLISKDSSAIFKSVKAGSKKIVTYSLLVIFIIALFYANYNYLRFNNPFEFGYSYQVFTDPFQQIRESSGRFSINYLINNIIYMFFNPPLPIKDAFSRYVFPYFSLSRYGVGLVFLMPWILLMFLDKLSRDQKKLLLTAAAVSLPSLLFNGEGSFQIGSRYANDFFPLLLFAYLPFLEEKESNKNLYKAVIAVSLIISLYMLFLVLSGYFYRY